MKLVSVEITNTMRSNILYLPPQRAEYLVAELKADRIVTLEEVYMTDQAGELYKGKRTYHVFPGNLVYVSTGEPEEKEVKNG